ncbi:NUDIX domain-containing protein [Nocardia sp. SC052]|uniref:NUDIX domain-containing protein n=1 Tax=Nocardia sichangensis TaxID=3385975 RepID=UPI0039A2F404
MQPSTAAVAEIVRRIAPLDELERRHIDTTLAWLASTDDIFRRARPATPPRHLVCYVVLVDPAARAVLLGKHRLAGLWLPTGGHVDPGEHPLDTARREAPRRSASRPDSTSSGPTRCSSPSPPRSARTPVTRTSASGMSSAVTAPTATPWIRASSTVNDGGNWTDSPATTPTRTSDVSAPSSTSLCDPPPTEVPSSRRRRPMVSRWRG